MGKKLRRSCDSIIGLASGVCIAFFLVSWVLSILNIHGDSFFTWMGIALLSYAVAAGGLYHVYVSRWL